MLSPITCLYAPFGHGHEIAARALAHAVSELEPTVAVECVDFLHYLPPLVGRVLRFSYREMASRARLLWALLYEASDAGRFPFLSHFGVARLLPRLANPNIGALFSARVPGVVVGTHPFATMLAAHANVAHGRASRICSVATDFRLHAAYTCPTVDRFFVPGEAAVQDLLGLGMRREAIYVAGMPVRPHFRTLGDRLEARRQVGLDPDRFTVLLMPHWHKRSFTLDLCRRLAALPHRLQVLVVAGRDATLVRLLQNASLAWPVVVRGWVDDVERMMACADVVVSKPGGQTVSEAIACERPLVMIDPIPGQEEQNARHIADLGLGTIARTVDEAANQVRAQIDGAAVGRQITAAERQHLGRFHRGAAVRIARGVLELAGWNVGTL